MFWPSCGLLWITAQFIACTVPGRHRAYALPLPVIALPPTVCTDYGSWFAVYIRFWMLFGELTWSPPHDATGLPAWHTDTVQLHRMPTARTTRQLITAYAGAVCTLYTVRLLTYISPTRLRCPHLYHADRGLRFGFVPAWLRRARCLCLRRTCLQLRAVSITCGFVCNVIGFRLDSRSSVCLRFAHGWRIQPAAAPPVSAIRRHRYAPAYRVCTRYANYQFPPSRFLVTIYLRGNHVG